VTAGLAAIVFVGAAMLVTGGMRIRGIALNGADLITSPLLWLVAMLFVGVMEEYLFRGYALQSLWRGAGFWPAALITTTLFAGDHLEKPHENAIDIGMIFALGIILCISVRVTGSLWWAVGWHATFDFGQLFIIGTPNGGRVPNGRLFDATFPGPAWITGGELGTEASYFMVLVVLGTLTTSSGSCGDGHPLYRAPNESEVNSRKLLGPTLFRRLSLAGRRRS
jgi:CAAX protease family protein